MADYRFHGKYKANLIGRVITFGTRLRRELEEYGISKMYLVGRETKRKRKHLRYIEVYPESPSEERGIHVKIKMGELKIPKGLIKYAGLKPDEVCIIGLSSDSIAICNSKEIDEYIEPPLSDKELGEVAEELTKNYRMRKLKKLRKH